MTAQELRATALRATAEEGFREMRVYPATLPEASRPADWTHALHELRQHASGEWQMRIQSRHASEKAGQPVLYHVELRLCTCEQWTIRAQHVELPLGDDGAALCKHGRLLQVLLQQAELPKDVPVIRSLPPEERTLAREQAGAELAEVFA